jgi:hypothetical protein
MMMPGNGSIARQWIVVDVGSQQSDLALAIALTNYLR